WHHRCRRHWPLQVRVVDAQPEDRSGPKRRVHEGSSMFQNQGPAYVDGVEIRIIPEDNTRLAEFQAGNVHLVQDVPQGDVERLNTTPGVSIVKYDQLQTSYLGFNTRKPPFDDPRVRQAVNLAINRDEIVTGANFGLGAT